MKELKKLIDVKSIVTLTLVFTLLFVVVANRTLDENVFLLFSNVTTMVITYFFAKKGEREESKNSNKSSNKI